MFEVSVYGQFFHKIQGACLLVRRNLLCSGKVQLFCFQSEKTFLFDLSSCRLICPNAYFRSIVERKLFGGDVFCVWHLRFLFIYVLFGPVASTAIFTVLSFFNFDNFRADNLVLFHFFSCTTLLLLMSSSLVALTEF